MILPSRENPPNLEISIWDEKLGKIEWVFLVYDKMRWKWTNIYLPKGPPDIYSPSSPDDVHGGHGQQSLEIQLETEINWTHICTWRLWSNEFGDAHIGCDQVSWVIHLEAVIKLVWWCNWRPKLSEFRDTPAGRDRASLDIQLEASVSKGSWVRGCSLGWELDWRHSPGNVPCPHPSRPGLGLSWNSTAVPFRQFYNFQWNYVL